MKKFLKISFSLLSATMLIPTTSILLSSCSNEEVYEEFDYTFNEQNPASDFTPTDKSTLQTATIEQAAADLFNAYKQKKQIFADQIVYQMIQSSILLPHHNHDIEGTIKIMVGDIDVVNQAISYKVDLDVTSKSTGEHAKALFSGKNFRQWVYYTGERAGGEYFWGSVDYAQYLSMQGVDIDMQKIILNSLRYDWELAYDLNTYCAQNVITRLYPFYREIITYIGPMSFNWNSKDIPSTASDIYQSAMAMQWHIIGNQTRPIYYLSNVELTE